MFEGEQLRKGSRVAGLEENEGVLSPRNIGVWKASATADGLGS